MDKCERCGNKATFLSRILVEFEHRLCSVCLNNFELWCLENNRDMENFDIWFNKLTYMRSGGGLSIDITSVTKNYREAALVAYHSFLSWLQEEKKDA